MAYHERFGFNHFIPYLPLHQYSRKQIQTGILALEEKIRIKKQIELQRSLQAHIARTVFLEQQNNHLKSIRYQQIERYKRVKSQMNISKHLQAPGQLKQTLTFRLQNNHFQNQSDQEIKKDSYDSIQKSKEHALQAQQNFKTQRCFDQFPQQVFATPYEIIKESKNSNLKSHHSFIREELQQRLDSQYHNMHNMKSSIQKTRNDYEESLNNCEAKTQTKDISKNHLKVSKLTVSHSKKRVKTQYSNSAVINRSKSAKMLEKIALKRISIRIQLSKVAYEDSQFRNIKYEVNHLLKTFQVEQQQRRSLKDHIILKMVK